MLPFTRFVLAFVALSSVYGCKHRGNTYSNGEEWFEKNAFVMKCTISTDGSWKTEVTGCLTPDQKKISINGTLEDGNDEWNCSLNNQGLVTLKQGINANVKCEGGFSAGDRWISKTFELECMPGGSQKLVSCVHPVGGKIGVNDTKVIEGNTVECTQFANGTVVMRSQRANLPVTRSSNAGNAANEVSPQIAPSDGNNVIVSCVDDQEKTRNVGEVWIENEIFQRKCVSPGVTEVTGCVTKEGKHILLNKEVVFDGMKYNCDRTDTGSIRFKATPVA
uniref:Sushi domain-containing protein n=1 Tax=Rhabditophanes sp. KR3021 TaxID=114890 RepID=A0AC35U9T7_9BILA